jgi:hypothetical protein
MRERLRPHLTFANVVSLLALFVALGGTTYAATGGNFILGKSNSAGSTTSLSAPIAGKALQLTNTSTGTGATALGLNVASGHPPFTVNSGTRVANLNSDRLDGINSTGFLRSTPPISITGPGGLDVLTARNTGNGRGLAGFSDSWQGVFGHSNTNAGVVGESDQFDGVFGVSKRASAAGVSGHNDAGGFGVWASGGQAEINTAAIHGQSNGGNAVEGISGRNIASGVYGQNNGTGFGVAGRSANGTGVMGDSSNGWAVEAFGNASQARGQSGFVKAMAFVEPGLNPSDPIRQCFNSQLPPSQASSGNCGITYSSDGTGRYHLDFGFQVNDRFASATAAHVFTVMTATPYGEATNTKLGVYAYDLLSDSFETSSFYIIVY